MVHAPCTPTCLIAPCLACQTSPTLILCLRAQPDAVINRVVYDCVLPPLVVPLTDSATDGCSTQSSTPEMPAIDAGERGRMPV